MSINVSLIFPIYSSLDSLKALFEEFNYIDNEDLESLEIIIINDASPNIKYVDINSLIKRLPKNINYNYICLDKNLGPGAVRNIGISKANTNKYVGFIDDDDKPNLKNIIRTSFSSNEDIVISPLFKFNNRRFLRIYYSNLIFFYFFLKGYLKTVAWNKLYKLRYIKQISANFSNQRLFEDELFFLKILFSKNKKTFRIIGNSFVKVCKRKNSRSRSFNHKFILTYFIVQKENFEFVSGQSYFLLLLWFFFFVPKSLGSFVFSYCRSIYYRRILNL